MDEDLDEEDGIIEKLLEQAVYDGVITCPKCGCDLEPDAKKCQCGWENELILGGYI